MFDTTMRFHTCLAVYEHADLAVFIQTRAETVLLILRQSSIIIPWDPGSTDTDFTRRILP